jgi:hypothetical protein
VDTLPDRLADLDHDPWEDLGHVRQSLRVDVLRQMGVST